MVTNPNKEPPTNNPHNVALFELLGCSCLVPFSHTEFLISLHVYALQLPPISCPQASATSQNLKPCPEEHLQANCSIHIFFIHRISSHMKHKGSNPLNLKFLFIVVFLAFLMLFVLRSSFSSPPIASVPPSSEPSHTDLPRPQPAGGAENCSRVCSKIPSPLAKALIHYTTSTITPQQTLKEIGVTARVLRKKSPCKFLVFGLGHDSLMWSSLNYGGQTVFLEEDEAWIEQIRRRFPTLKSYHVTYDSKVNQAGDLMEVGRGPECTAVGDPRYSMCQLALKGLPAEVYETEWDLIMVDAPTGYYEEAPGRMTAIYTAGMMARNRKDSAETDVFVHDVNRPVEDKFSMAFLCEGYMKKQEGRLRHFTIPSFRDDFGKPFCPQ